MLRSAHDLRGYTIHATDGEIGSVNDLLFDDDKWTIRYLALNTGNWLTGRLVLISPIAVSAVNLAAKTLDVKLTKQQVEQSPDLVTDQPISREYEAEYARYYDYSPYWGGPGIWGASMFPGSLSNVELMPLEPDPVAEQTDHNEHHRNDPHLHSVHEVTGYHIHASDGEIGHVDDFLVDDENWSIRYLAVDTRNWWPGKKVLVAPQWIKGVSWPDAAVTVDLARDVIQAAPEYDPATFSREYETSLYGYYKRPGYWEAAGSDKVTR